MPRPKLERDLTLAEAARLLGHSSSTLRESWGEIPSAYVTEGGRYYVNPVGLRQWLQRRGANTNAGVAAPASQAR